MQRKALATRAGICVTLAAAMALSLGAGRSLAQSDQSLLDKAGQDAGEAWDATKEGASDAWDATKETSSEAWDATKEGAEKAYDGAAEAVEKASE